MKPEFGGGTRSFSCEEDFIYENVESELRFFTSQVTAVRSRLRAHSLRAELTPVFPQERQSIIRFWLQNLRAKQGETLHNVRFLEDQPISEQCKPAVIAILGRELGVPVRRQGQEGGAWSNKQRPVQS